MRFRPEASFALSRLWQQCGNALALSDGGEAVLYVPFRRSGSPSLYDEGSVRKFALSDSLQGRLIWQSSVPTVRRILIPPFEGGTPQSGPCREISSDDAASSFASLDAEQWRALCGLLKKAPLRAPWPASFVEAEGMLYTVTDDGLVCALDAETGREAWAFLPPQVLSSGRIKAYMEATSHGAVPFLTSGGLTAEKVSSGRQNRLFLWGTLGKGARGLFCLDVTDSDKPLFMWSREERQDETILYGARDDQRSELGFCSAAPLAVPLDGVFSLLLPNGEGSPGGLSVFHALTGEAIASEPSLEQKSLCLTPSALKDGSGGLSRVLCCDDEGGIQVFLRKGRFPKAEERVDLARVSGAEKVRCVFSPIACPLYGEDLFAFVAECRQGTVVAAAPAECSDLQWAPPPRRGKREAWAQILEGFRSPFAALCLDGFLYLLGWEEQSKTLKILDLRRGTLSASEPADKEAAGLVALKGRAVVVKDGGSASIALAEASSGSLPASVKGYTLFR